MALQSKQKAGLIGAFLSVVVLLLAGVALMIWAPEDDQPQAVDFRAAFNEHALHAAGLESQADNQWTTFEQVIGIVTELDDLAAGRTPGGPTGQTATIDYHAALAADEGAPERLRAAAALVQLEERGVFRMLDDLAADPRAARLFPLEGPPMHESVPSLVPHRQLARALALRTRLAFIAGDEQASRRALQHGLATGRIVAQQPTAMDWLVGVAIASMMGERMREEVLAQRPGEDLLLGFIDDLQRFPPVPITSMLPGERLIGQEGLLRSLRQRDGLLRGLNRDGMIEMLGEFTDVMIAYASQPPSRRDAALAAKLDEFDQLGTQFSLVTAVFPSHARMLQANDQNEAEHNGTIVLLAIEAHIARHGTPPEALAKLVPEFLESLPRDPFHHAGFRYRRLQEGPRMYILYSVGADGEDDGGVSPEGARARAFTPEGAGSDYIFNP